MQTCDAFSMYMSSSSKGTNVVAGATGYIGRAMVQESIKRGYNTVALVRDVEKLRKDEHKDFFRGAQIVQCDVTNVNELTKTLQNISESCEGNKIESVISCLASRSGIKKDAYAIDYQATRNCLDSGIACGARHFVLLSAFCVKNPWLQFQQAKLKFEADLRSQSDMTWSIVRPTAFFKSLSGQLEPLQSGSPYVLFGNGEVTRCNPISESDLATFMVNCISDKTKENKILNIGGPDEPITQKIQGKMLFDVIGKTPEYVSAPLWIFDVIIDSFQWAADTFKIEKFENAAEVGRIGKYYAVEDMLTTDPDEKFGTMTLKEHYEKIAVEGQEYDPYIAWISRARAKVFLALGLVNRS